MKHKVFELSPIWADSPRMNRWYVWSDAKQAAIAYCTSYEAACAAARLFEI